MVKMMVMQYSLRTQLCDSFEVYKTYPVHYWSYHKWLHVLKVSTGSSKICTEHQKKHHFFRVTFSEIHCIKTIHIRHTSGKFILNKHIPQKNFTSIKEEINAMKSQGVNFQKSQKLVASWAESLKQTIGCTAFTQPGIEIECSE